MIDEEQPGERERRGRLIYWIRRGMAREGVNQAEFARRVGAPASNVSRWLSPNEKTVPGIPWLGAICLALKLDPMLFAKLPAIPEDPLETFALPDDSDLLVAIDAARLAQLDADLEAEEAPLVAFAPAERPGRPKRQGAHRCPQGSRSR